MEDNELTGKIIEAAITVHKALGPGLLESVYEECLCHELSLMGLKFERQKSLPIQYRSVKLDGGLRLDLLVENQVVVEVKAVDRLSPLFTAQLLTYLKLSGIRWGLLINFNTVLLRDGIKRLVVGYGEDGGASREHGATAKPGLLNTENTEGTEVKIKK